MHVEPRIDVLVEPQSVIDMLKEICASSGIPAFEFVGYIPACEYDFTAIVGRKVISPNSIETIRTEDIARNIIEEKYVNVADGEHILGELAIGLSSKIPDGRHLPQIDFCCGSDYEEDLYDFLMELKINGYILFSGRSYHFQGSEPVEESVWRELMCTAKNNDLVDGEWVIESEEQGYSVLRLTDCSEKPYAPVVVAQIKKQLKYEGQLELSF